MENPVSDNTISIGDITVQRIGLGTNRLTDSEETRKFLQQAVRLGLNFIDTADIYTGGASEQTIGNALSPFPEGLVVATKGGMVRGSAANNSPEHLKKVLDQSLKSLKTSCITLYQLHRVNTDTPIKDTMNFLNQMQHEGKIKYIGLSEVTVPQIEEARKTAEIISVQNHFNLGERKHEAVIDYCEKNNIVFIPFFPLDRGNIPVQSIEKLALKYESTPHQIILAWLLKRSPVMLPIPGTLSIKHLEENLASLNIKLSDEDFNILNSLRQ